MSGDQLNLDAIEEHAHKTADQGSGSDPHTVLALVAEVRRLRADIDECWVPLYHSTKAEHDAAVGMDHPSLCVCTECDERDAAGWREVALDRTDP